MKKHGRKRKYSDVITQYFLLAIVILHSFIDIVRSANWCDLDTGKTTITDANGFPFSVYISLTRDGSVWMRIGSDHMTHAWNYRDETTRQLQTTLLQHRPLEMMLSLNTSSFCVLTDLDLSISNVGGWHPTYIKTYNQWQKKNTVMAFKPINACDVNTTIRLSVGKQGLICEGGARNTCGMRNLPRVGEKNNGVLMTFLKIAPRGDNQWSCEAENTRSRYTFTGSYYQAFIKIASCPPPQDSRMLGYEAKLRSGQDKLSNAVILTDPHRRVMTNSIIKSWQIFIQEVSPEHTVYLQVWRPQREAHRYALVGQTHLAPDTLRFQEVVLSDEERIHVLRGDVLGIYFPLYNPVSFSQVPCSTPAQMYRFARDPLSAAKLNAPHAGGGIDNGDVIDDVGGDGTAVDMLLPGQLLDIYPAPPHETMCRHYSVTALFANKTTAKLIEDWECPNPNGIYRPVVDHPLYSADTERPMTEQERNLQAVRNMRAAQRIIFPPGQLAIIVMAALLGLLLIIGIAAYCKAVRS